MNILMVEDDASDAELLATTLKKADRSTQIEHTRTLSEACSQVRRTDYDAVILDLALPDSDGLSTVRRLHDANDCVPIVVMSGRDDDELAKEAVHIGAEDYMVKGDKSGPGILRTIHYAIERHHNAEEMRFLAHHDPLTGAANRNELIRELDRLIAAVAHQKQMIGIFVIDLDHFKVNNELFGYDAGDQILKDSAHRIRTRLRGGDMVARLKGDQLAVLAPGLASERAAELVGEHLHQAFATPIRVDDHDVRVTVTIGIALYPNDGSSADSLLSKADSAMHDAKEHGRNRSHFFSDDAAHLLRKRRELRRELQTAIEQDRFEFWYQPRFKRDGYELHSLSASLKWRHPHRGLVPAEEFMLNAEGEDLIEIIEERSIDSIVAQLEVWMKSQTIAPCVSLHVSTELFQVTSFPERVELALLTRSVDPWRLEISVHENAFDRDVGKTVENIHKLSDMGVRTAIDCVGAGPAPTYYMANVPLDTTNINKALVANLESPRMAAIADMLIRLSHDLGQSVTADGVTTESQFTRLANMRCDAFQGDFLLPPLNAHEAGQVLRYAEGHSDKAWTSYIANNNGGSAMP